MDNFDQHLKRIYLVTDSCSTELQCFSCTVYKFAYLLTYLFNGFFLTSESPNPSPCFASYNTVRIIHKQKLLNFNKAAGQSTVSQCGEVR